MMTNCIYWNSQASVNAVQLSLKLPAWLWSCLTGARVRKSFSPPHKKLLYFCHIHVYTCIVYTLVQCVQSNKCRVTYTCMLYFNFDECRAFLASRKESWNEGFSKMNCIMKQNVWTYYVHKLHCSETALSSFAGTMFSLRFCSLTTQRILSRVTNLSIHLVSRNISHSIYIKEACNIDTCTLA